MTDWTLEDFLPRLDQWIELETPDQDLVNLATAWVLTRAVDPYRGVRREAGFPNLWFGEVPGSRRHVPGQVVVCSYWITERTQTVRCNMFGTLNLPV